MKTELYFPVHFDGYPNVACGRACCSASIVTNVLGKVTCEECMKALFRVRVQA